MMESCVGDKLDPIVRLTRLGKYVARPEMFSVARGSIPLLQWILMGSPKDTCSMFCTAPQPGGFRAG